MFAIFLDRSSSVERRDLLGSSGGFDDVSMMVLVNGKLRLKNTLFFCFPAKCFSRGLYVVDFRRSVLAWAAHIQYTSRTISRASPVSRRVNDFYGL